MNYLPGIIAILITIPLPLLGLFLIKRELKKKPTTSECLEVLDNRQSTPKQNAEAFCSLINAYYICVLVKTNNGGKYDDEKHVNKFKKSVTTDRIHRLNAIANKMNAERIPYEYD